MQNLTFSEYVSQLNNAFKGQNIPTIHIRGGEGVLGDSSECVNTFRTIYSNNKKPRSYAMGEILIATYPIEIISMHYRTIYP